MARAPSLQELVQRFGGYHLITPEAWAEFDAAMAEFHRVRRVELVGEGRVVGAETKAPKRRKKS